MFDSGSTFGYDATRMPDLLAKKRVDVFIHSLDKFMALTEVAAHMLAAKVVQRSRKVDHDAESFMFDFVASLKNMENLEQMTHREGGRKDGIVNGYMRFAEVRHEDGYSAFLLQRGDDERPAPMIGGADTAEVAHVQVGDKEFPSWSCHVVVGHEPMVDAIDEFPVVIEYVPFLSKTRIEQAFNNFLRMNHFDDELGYKVYHHLELRRIANFTLGEFLKGVDVDAEVELIAPNYEVDAVDDKFTARFTATKSVGLWRKSFDKVVNWAAARQDSRVRIRAEHNGMMYSGEVESYDCWAEAKLGMSAVLSYEPPKSNWPTSLNDSIVEQMVGHLKNLAAN